FPRQPEVSQYCPRNERSVRDLGGIEGRGTAEAAEEHLPAWTFEAGTPARQVRARNSVGDRKAPELPRLRIEAGQALVGSQPKLARAVFQNAAHHVSRETVLLVIGLEGPGIRVKFVQTVLRADPHIARAIEMDGIYAIVAQRARVVGVVLVD